MKHRSILMRSQQLTCLVVRSDKIELVCNIHQGLKMRQETSDCTSIAEALEWSKDSVLKDETGRPMILYHGSPTLDIEDFEHGNTAYGIFFAEDSSTANYYSGEEGRLYQVLLNVRKIADLDDEEMFDKIARESIDFTEVRDQEAAFDFAARLYAEGYNKHPVVTEFFNEVDGINEVCQEYTIQELLRDERVDVSAIEELVKEIGTEKVKAAFDEAAPASSEELEAARQAYGSQDFYMEYQDDFMRSAHRLGYDCVIFTDPSSSGNPASHVVFSADKILILSDDVADELNDISKKNKLKISP